MLTKEQARKLGLPIIDLNTEVNKIDSFATNLNSRISLVESTLPIITTVPLESNSDGVPGSIAFDDEFLYICTNINTWKRVLLNEL